MAVRSDTRVDVLPKGTLRTSTGSMIGGSYDVVVGSESRTDIVAAGDNHPFQVEKWRHAGGIINGTGKGGRQASNYVADALATTGNWPHIGLLDSPSNTVAATIAAARTNPSAPIVDVPRMVLELPEIISLIRSTGKDLIKKAARRNVEWNFAVAPLVSDLAKLAAFKNHFDRRVSMIKKLQAQGYKRTVVIYRGSANSDRYITYQSNGLLIGGMSSGSTTQEVKAHTRWYPSADMSRYNTPDAIGVIAKKAIRGLTIDGLLMWESLPWSWFLDWAGTIGLFFRAHRNIIPAHLHAVTVMRHTRSSWTTANLTSSEATGKIPMSAHKFVRESKSRDFGLVAPVAHFPFLSGNQMGTLASLALLKRR